MKLTSKELIALKDLWNSSRGNGHDFGYGDDVPSLPKASRGGVVASLSNKGIIDYYDDYGQIVFSEKGRSLFVSFDDSSDLKEENMKNLSQTTETTTTTETAPKAPVKAASKKTAPAKKVAAKATPPKGKAKEAPKPTKKPVAKATKEVAVKKGTSGLKKPQERILKFLEKQTEGMSRAAIAEFAPCDVAGCVEQIGSHDEEKRLANDAKHFPSLITLGLVKFAMPAEGTRGVVYSITAKGKQVAAKIPL